MTFAGFNLIKYLEAVIAAYACCVGVLFLTHPEVLNARVYDPWQEVGAAVWGASLVAVSIGHFAALWLNGRRRLLSRVIRAASNLAHFYISLKFAALFLASGAHWGVLTFTLLMPGLILPVLASTFEEARKAAYER